MLFTSHNGGKIEPLTVKSQICVLGRQKSKVAFEATQKFELPPEAKKVKITTVNLSAS